jgi:hypothetical protein
MRTRSQGHIALPESRTVTLGKYRGIREPGASAAPKDQMLCGRNRQDSRPVRRMLSRLFLDLPLSSPGRQRCGNLPAHARNPRRLGGLCMRGDGSIDRCRYSVRRTWTSYAHPGH